MMLKWWWGWQWQWWGWWRSGGCGGWLGWWAWWQWWWHWCSEAEKNTRDEGGSIGKLWFKGHWTAGWGPKPMMMMRMARMMMMIRMMMTMAPFWQFYARCLSKMEGALTNFQLKMEPPIRERAGWKATGEILFHLFLVFCPSCLHLFCFFGHICWNLKVVQPIWEGAGWNATGEIIFQLFWRFFLTCIGAPLGFYLLYFAENQK